MRPSGEGPHFTVFERKLQQRLFQILRHERLDCALERITEQRCIRLDESLCRDHAAPRLDVVQLREKILNAHASGVQTRSRHDDLAV
jgi:hypothetical protein